LYEFGPYLLDPDDRLLLYRTRPVPLTPKAFDTLVALVKAGGRAVSKHELMRSVWPDAAVEEGTLTQNIFILRKILVRDPGDHEYIETVPKHGYRLARQVKRPSTDVLSVAVLPFKPISSGKREESLELGIADAIITRLSTIRHIAVRPVSALRKYARLDQDAVDAGRDLRVQWVVEGTFQRLGSRIRLSVRLINVADARPRWAQSFDEPFTNIFDVQDAISERVASELLHRILIGQRPAAPMQRYTVDVDAYLAYVMGRFLASKRTADALRAAITCFEQALLADPAYALAYAGLSETYLLINFFQTVPVPDALRKAADAARTAVALDETLADAHVVLEIQ